MISPKNLHSSLNVSHSFANTSCLSSFPLHHHSNFHSVPPHPPNVVPHDDTTPSSLPMSKTIAIHIFNDINLTPSRHFQKSFLLSSNSNTHSSLHSLSLSLSLQLNFFNLKYVRKRKRWTRKEKGKEHFPLGKGRTSVPSRTYRSLLEERWIQQTCRRWCPSLHGRRP